MRESGNVAVFALTKKMHHHKRYRQFLLLRCQSCRAAGHVNFDPNTRRQVIASFKAVREKLL